MSLWRRAALRPVSTQAQRAAGRALQKGIWLAVESVLRCGRLPAAQDTPVAEVSRPPRVSRHHRGADLDDAIRRNTCTGGPIDAGLRRRPPNGHPMAGVVAQDIYG